MRTRLAGLAGIALAMAGCATPPARLAPPPVVVSPLSVAERARTCRQVGDVASIRIDPASAAALAQIGLDRAGIFASMHDTSVPETMGCWAMPTGNFDSQLVSVGMAQWNFGTGSLQPLLTAWRDRFSSRRAFAAARDAMTPIYGKLLFSKDCLAVPVTAACRAGILAAEDAKGALGQVLDRELTALFDSDAMLQVQADSYVALLLKVRDDLLRVFPAGSISPRKVRWAIDTRVQQGALPGDEDIARLRRKLAAIPAAERAPRLHAIIDWYGALARTIDQDGIAHDAAWNVAAWHCLIDAGRIDDEQNELLSITFLRSRTAIGNSGRWQALTFERRATIVLGVGSVSGVRTGECGTGTGATGG
ncbi:MAG: hypothetical protein J0I47_01710 [Sphingomonas sp.]|uniref:hypothetical protein n=1 Tax=Sphingomonas sp. TaxID=28214 RepID=UPI001ACDD4D8|nr:hypothetical protein [Sphingomonas sp.]MBN8806945.1 hypothetical protein [Sphingomonas sp.]